MAMAPSISSLHIPAHRLITPSASSFRLLLPPLCFLGYRNPITTPFASVSSSSLSVYASQRIDAQKYNGQGVNILYQSEDLQSFGSYLGHQIHNVLQREHHEDAKLTHLEHRRFSNSRDSRSLQLTYSLLRNFVISLGIFSISTGLFCGCAQASEATIKASHLGLKVASVLRQTGWPDEAIVFFMAMLPVLELRGAIPVGYWMQLDPLKLSVLSILGNMVPVPFIVLYMAKLASFLASRSSTAKKIIERIFESTRRKAGPIQEFKWLGLMLFVAVPFPGTGAWTGAMAASVLGMTFWDAISANFFGVVMAGVLVNLLVNLGFKYALVVGAGLFFASTFMWRFLRVMMKKADLDADH